MVNLKTFRKIALSFPEATEEPHFEKISFRVNKKIFATYDSKNKRACIKLSEVDQNVFSSFDRSVVFPVPDKWGKQGWTFINLNKVRKDMFTDALSMAYCMLAPKKFSSIVRLREKE
ncbi:MAG: MmcQ/YjbR family DNA-binding protein [Bacteroidetes bacterium]|nr:MmcQ/YjbR family DNA-binding protein [Bacteroidota bacterium]